MVKKLLFLLTCMNFAGLPCLSALNDLPLMRNLPGNIGLRMRKWDTDTDYMNELIDWLLRALENHLLLDIYSEDREKWIGLKKSLEEKKGNVETISELEVPLRELKLWENVTVGRPAVQDVSQCLICFGVINNLGWSFIDGLPLFLDGIFLEKDLPIFLKKLSCTANDINHIFVSQPGGGKLLLGKFLDKLKNGKIHIEELDVTLKEFSQDLLEDLIIAARPYEGESRFKLDVRECYDIQELKNPPRDSDCSVDTDASPAPRPSLGYVPRIDGASKLQTYQTLLRTLNPLNSDFWNFDLPYCVWRDLGEMNHTVALQIEGSICKFRGADSLAQFFVFAMHALEYDSRYGGYEELYWQNPEASPGLIWLLEHLEEFKTLKILHLHVSGKDTLSALSEGLIKNKTLQKVYVTSCPEYYKAIKAIGDERVAIESSTEGIVAESGHDET